jgi:hypothetical protein
MLFLSSALFDVVGFGEIIEVTPAILLPLCIFQFFLREALHGTNIFRNFPLSEFRNSDFCKVYDEESLDYIPVLDVPFSLSDPVQYCVLLSSFATLTFEYSFKGEFTLADLVV